MIPGTVYEREGDGTLVEASRTNLLEGAAESLTSYIPLERVVTVVASFCVQRCTKVKLGLDDALSDDTEDDDGI